MFHVCGGGGGQVMLVAGREKVHFMGCQIGSIRVLHQKVVSQFRIGRDEGNGAMMEGQRNAEVYLSATRSFERLLFFLEYPCHGDQFCLLFMVKFF